MELNGKNCLIAYFSHRGMNYTSSGIVELSVGNTQIAAELIAGVTGGRLFEIEAAHEYPFEYDECTRVAQAEKSANARPALIKQVDNIGGYDIIFLGYPNWWGTCPMPVLTFLETHELSGKLIAPFCTNEGSGMGASERDIKAAAASAVVLTGLPIRGSDAARAKSAITNWIKGI